VRLTGTQRLQGVMAAPEGAGQVPLCAASEQQEEVDALLLLRSRIQLFVSELHSDYTAPLQRGRESMREGDGRMMEESEGTRKTETNIKRAVNRHHCFYLIPIVYSVDLP